MITGIASETKSQWIVDMRIAVYGTFPSNKEDIERVVILFEELLKTYPCKDILLWSVFYKKLQSYYPSLSGVGTFNCREDLIDRCDILLSLGGDGTMLDTVDYVIGSNIAVLGINLGHLGFLTSVGREDIYGLFKELEQKNFTIEKRQVIEMYSKDNNMHSVKRFAVNEACFLSSNRGSILDLEVFVEDEYLTTFSGDGVLIATPTGSTAYSLSCNGPIIAPQSECICITPVSPHNLTFRPIIIPSYQKIKVRVPQSENPCKMLMDGYTIFENTQGEVTIQIAPYNWNLLRFEKQSFFQAIRKKLMWGTKPQYMENKQ